MKKFVLAVFLAVLALVSVIAIYPSHASTATTMSIDSSTQQFPSATVGSTIQINIEVSNVQGLWAWDVAGLTFNPAYLNLTGVAKVRSFKKLDRLYSSGLQLPKFPSPKASFQTYLTRCFPIPLKAEAASLLP